MVTSDLAARHVVPPMTTQRQAEEHGVLDAGGRLDPSTYAMLVARDAALPEIVHPMTGKGFPVAVTGFSLPFLPDPMAQVTRDARLRAGRGRSVEQVRLPWYRGGASWPDARPSGRGARAAGRRGTRSDLGGRSGGRSYGCRWQGRPGAGGGHELDDRAAALLGIWRWAEPHLAGDPAREARVRGLAQGGEHWMLTPWYDAEIVHAVQKPLVTPAIEGQADALDGPDVGVRLFSTPVDTRSTEKLDLVGRWLDPWTTRRPRPPGARGGGARAAELPFERLDAPGVDPPGPAVGARTPVTHEFGDTRYRRIGYRFTATTRFTTFMPAPLRDPAAAATSQYLGGGDRIRAQLGAPATAGRRLRGPDLRMDAVGPGEDGEQRSKRGGGGLRDLPSAEWLVSGYLEMLGSSCHGRGSPARRRQVDEGSQWGADPTWRSASVLPAAPAPEPVLASCDVRPDPAGAARPTIPLREGDIPEAAAAARVPLPGEPGTPAVDVAPHLVHYDEERRLWYADVGGGPGPAYTPFIRLALARYQPISARARICPPR